MPMDKAGKFHINPGVARMHDAAPPVASKKGSSFTKTQTIPGEQDLGHKHVELHEGPHANAPGAAFHTIHHGHTSEGPGGGGLNEPEVRGHASLHEAHHAMNEHFEQDGCKGDGTCEHGGGDEGGAAEGSNMSGDEEY
jgi:hypothetical protein